MGNTNSDYIKGHVEREFERVKRSKNRDFLTVEEARKLKSVEDMPINFKKLAVLFMLDMDKNGKFTLKDMNRFAVWCGRVTEHMNSSDPQTFKSELQAQCTLAMWKQVCLVENGKRSFSHWFQRLFSAGMAVRMPQYPGQLYLSTDTVATLHDILSIQELYGINVQSMIDLMQRVGEEMDILNLDDESLDDVIPITVVHIFADNFIDGFINMMKSLDFTVEKYRSIMRVREVDGYQEKDRRQQSPSSADGGRENYNGGDKSNAAGKLDLSLPLGQFQQQQQGRQHQSVNDSLNSASDINYNDDDDDDDDSDSEEDISSIMSDSDSSTLELSPSSTDSGRSTRTPVSSKRPIIPALNFA